MAIFHLAIPTHDTDAAADFYTKALGATVARRYDDRVTLKFFNHQVVCHLAPEDIPTEIKMYPRHFGITFDNKADFDTTYERCQQSGFPLYRERFMRFGDLPEKHETFFIADLSNNLIEFKYYYDQQFNY